MRDKLRFQRIGISSTLLVPTHRRFYLLPSIQRDTKLEHAELRSVLFESRACDMSELGVVSAVGLGKWRQEQGQSTEVRRRGGEDLAK